MSENNAQLIKSLMVNIGIFLILVSATVSKDISLTYFFLGLLLLAVQTMGFKLIEPKKLTIAEIIISSSLSVSAVIQLTLSKSFGAPQVFLIILLLGGLLVTVEVVRKFADL